MIERVILVASLWTLVTSCHAPARPFAPDNEREAPCEGTDCRGNGEQPSAESGDTALSHGSAGVSTAAADGDAGSQCSGLAEADCRTSQQCVPITDLRGVYRGCGPSGGGCNEVETCASNGEITVLFPDSCIPKGYRERSSAACEAPRK